MHRVESAPSRAISQLCRRVAIDCTGVYERPSKGCTRYGRRKALLWCGHRHQFYGRKRRIRRVSTTAHHSQIKRPYRVLMGSSRPRYVSGLQKGGGVAGARVGRVVSHVCMPRPWILRGSRRPKPAARAPLSRSDGRWHARCIAHIDKKR